MSTRSSRDYPALQQHLNDYGLGEMPFDAEGRLRLSLDGRLFIQFCIGPLDRIITQARIGAVPVGATALIDRILDQTLAVAMQRREVVTVDLAQRQLLLQYWHAPGEDAAHFAREVDGFIDGLFAWRDWFGQALAALALGPERNRPPSAVLGREKF